MRLSKKLIHAGIIFAFLVVGFQQAKSAQPASAAPDLLNQLEELSGGTARVSYHSQTGYVRFVGVQPEHAIPAGNPPTQPAPEPEAAARQFLDQYGALFGLTDPEHELTLMVAQTDPVGSSMVRFQQVYAGIPVLAGELIVNLDGKNAVLSTGGEILPRPRLDPVPTVDAQTAQEQALAQVSRLHNIPISDLVATPPELWVYNPLLLEAPGMQSTSLTWRMEVTANNSSDIRELVLVDAHLGAVILHFNQADTSLRLQTYTAKNSTSLPGTFVCDQTNPTCSNGDLDARDAHMYAADTYNFYLAHFNRDSINAAGMTIRSTVHYGRGYKNAFWSGAQMVYGDGLGFAQADDVVAHELTHGVTDYTSRLFYYFQSGAINEAISDIFGEFVDQTNGKGNDTPQVKWLLGEDIAGWGAIRDMRNPHNYAQPEKMTDPYYWDCDPYLNDNGGVHSNSGVANKAAYLMTDGDTFNGQTISGLGINKTAAIWYYAETHLLTSGSDYNDLNDDLQQACSVLAGTNGITPDDCQQVKHALDAVEMSQQPPSCPAQEAPICTGTRLPTTIYNDDFEPPAALRWTKGKNWFLVPADAAYIYATSGSYSLLGYDQPDVGNYAVTMNTPVYIPGATQRSSPYLRFNHSFMFDYGGYDGGVLEYALDGSNNWVDAGYLMVNNGYNGTIISGYGNPLGGLQAFINVSYGYISSRLDLSSLGGHTARFRFRIGTDQSYSALGWFIDDFRIYTCDEPLLVVPIYVRIIPVINGDFEKGNLGWVKTSSQGRAVITNSLPAGVTAHSGSYVAWLGGTNNETATLTQSVHVPSGYTSLNYYAWIDSQETNCGNDLATISIDGVVKDPLDLCTANNTSGWVKHTVDLSAYAGQTVSLQFSISTDGSGVSSLYLDDVALTNH